MRHAAAFVLVGIVGLALVLFAGACIIGLSARSLAPRPMAAAVQTLPPMKELTGDVIPRIACAIPPSPHHQAQISVGTGTWIGPDLVMTAAHVVEGSIGCFANEQRAGLVRDFHDLDIAFLSARNPTGLWAPISCDGIIPGEDYETSGYADGDGYRRTAIWQGLDGPVVDTGANFDGMARFEGLVREGMSGSPIWQRRTGRVVAIVNAGNDDAPHDVWGRSLADTYLCTAEGTH